MGYGEQSYYSGTDNVSLCQRPAWHEEYHAVPDQVTFFFRVSLSVFSSVFFFGFSVFQFSFYTYIYKVFIHVYFLYIHIQTLYSCSFLFFYVLNMYAYTYKVCIRVYILLYTKSIKKYNIYCIYRYAYI